MVVVGGAAARAPPAVGGATEIQPSRRVNPLLRRRRHRCDGNQIVGKRQINMQHLALDKMPQHQLVILRRLKTNPLTEFELAHEVAEHSGYSNEEAADRMKSWLSELQALGLIWLGSLTNFSGQQLMAAALTALGRRLVW